MDPNLVFLLAGGVGFVCIAGIAVLLLGGDSSSAKATKRLAGVGSGPARGAQRSSARNPAEQAGARRKQILTGLKELERQERKEKLTLEARLRQAGLTMPVKTFWIISGGVGFVFALLAMVLSRNVVIGAGVLFVGGFGLPRWWIGMLGARRLKAFTGEFPNAIDVVVRGIKSGLPVNDCLKLIAQESPEPSATEFRKLLENLSGGLTTDEAMQKMYGRMPTPEVRFFAIVLSIQSKTGGNLAEALNNLSVVLRSRALMKEKIKAMSGEAVASAAIIGCLPPGILIMVTVTTPGYMVPLFTTSTGHIALGIGVVMMATGIFVMRRMINFKF